MDNLRAVAVLLLIPFHTARLFDGQPWHMKDATAPYWLAEFTLRLIGLWQMPLLFLLAGMAAAWALERRGPRAFLHARAARLLLPLAFGMLVLVPPQVWVERATPQAPLRQSPIDFAGGYPEFLSHALECCYPAGNLSWHHLWFLPYLFAYAVAIAALARTTAWPALARRVATAPWLLLPAGMVLVAIELALRPAFPSTHDLVTDWGDHAHYLFLVLFGWWLARHPGLDLASRSIRHAATLAAGAGLLLWLASMPAARGGLGLFDLPWAARHGLRIATEWLVLLAMLGQARRWLDRPLPGLAAFAPLSLAFYMLHQTIIVLLGWAWFGWSGQPLTKALAVGAAALLLSLAGAALVARAGWLRPLFGMPRRPAAGRG
ncbi:acyltransferase family protein [Allostella humosa]|uniref:acyltransferase family protein n=1 Tax=Stella humosa TaxID=94 RepID=UPI0014777110|nr:acyltransferase family protein [Stella humosa]